LKSINKLNKIPQALQLPFDKKYPKLQAITVDGVQAVAAVSLHLIH